ncbi:hypothetical protein J6500_12870 [Bradyrhizobium sp. WSM 1704]|uniref:MSCRAMM family protein n=1 Tax=Bradyrhizobium semiaridum TaxID=2821404 RepID=UPI001CE2B5FC|nr:SdrD B-like domain-containing protein [Bradyrhizobium semiaridum]MCA6122782.1 hypothetical protein [Bradyrhizobium semiaridum]
MATYKFNSATGTYTLSDELFLVSTDQSDYAPGSTATFTAGNVTAGGSIQFTVLHAISPGPDGIWGTIDDEIGAPLSGSDPWTVTDGGVGDLDGVINGSITTSWYVNADAANQSFLLTADDPALGLKATTSFTDSTLIDLTFQNTRTITSGSVTAIFSTDQVSVGAGTGLLDPFSQIGGNTTAVQGYNTDFNDFVLDNAGKGGTNFIHSLKLSDLPIEFVGSTGYYRFELDINQLNSADKILLSLNALQIWQASVGNLNNYVPGATPDAGTGAFPAGSATLIYNLDAGGDKFIGLNGSLQSGSGNTTDMTFLVPITAFDPNQAYVYLYSAFGYEPGTFNYNYVDGNGTTHTGTSAWTNNDGFEEWNRQIGQVIDGHKFNDLNNNHTWDAGEPALNGWRIYLDFNNNNQLDAGEPSVLTGSIDLDNDGDTTDANEQGYYRFFVTPGTYTIREIQQANWVQTAPNNAQGEFSVTLASGADAHNLDFGNVQTASISGHKYEDADASNSTTGDRTAVSGWTITLYNDANHNNVADAGEQVAQTTTDATGSYSFTGILPGDYLIKEEDRSGWVHLSSAQINQDSVTSGQNLTNQDFVNYRTASISGHKYEDADASNATTGDRSAVSGWTITLYNDANHNNVADAGEQVAQTTTDATGSYSFTGLTPGDYLIKEEDRSGWVHLSSAQINQDSVTSGQNLTNQDFVNYRLGSISGHKYEDADASNATTGDRSAVSGWTITLYNDANHNNVADAGEQVAQTTTDATGSYSFTGLTPGDYLIKEEDRSGWVHLSSAQINQDGVTSGQNLTNQDFVNYRTASISGHKYEDADASNATTGDRTAVSGWTITLYNDANHNNVADAGEQVAQTTTDATGTYSFTGLTPGDYLIKEEDRSGWVHLSSAQINQDSVTSGQNLTNQDFVNYRTASISGHKYDDADASNATTGDRTAVSGWTITLYNDANHNNVADAGEQVAQTTTDATGTYSFTGLTPGDYLIKEEDRSGWVHLSSAQINQDSVTSGQNLTSQDFVNYRTTSISGHKYEDADASNATTGDRTAVSGWTITLYNDANHNNVADAGEQVAQTTTDATGSYSFTGLTPGDYLIKEEDRSGWVHLSSAQINQDGVTSGQNLTNQDFVNYRTASISGHKYEDADASNATTGDRTAVSGWTITLYNDANHNNVADAGEQVAQTTTDATGSYSFTGLTPGDYLIKEEDRSGWVHLSSAQINQDSLTSGQNLTNQDFVNYRLASISGHKYEDADASNSTTGDRTAVSGWTITLYNDANHNNVADAGEQVAQTTTDATGTYSFTGLTPGDYLIKEEDRSGWAHLSSAQINQDGVTSGQNLTNQDFVNYRLASISGHKYDDADASNSTTGDRTAVSGWTITLYNDINHNNVADAGEQVAQTTTDATGSYSFTGLTPGDYLIKEEDRSGWQHLSPVQINQDSVTSGQNLTSQDFVNYANGSIHGLKFEDLNANGLLDSNETGMAGVTIRLTGDIDGDGDSDTVDFVTGADGQFHFENLHPGVYTLTELFTDGQNWVATVDHGDADSTGDNHTTVTVQSGQELVWHAGAAGSISDPQHEVLGGQLSGGNAYQLMFGNHAVGGVGLTPGFWANHLYVWDGDENNGPKDGQGVLLAQKLADAGVIEDKDILDLLPENVDVDGDGHKDLMFEANGKCLIIEWDDARDLVNQSNGTGGDKLGDFARYAITTLLNDVGVPGFNAPNNLIGDIADWLIQYGPTTTAGAPAGCSILKYNSSAEAGKDGFPGGSTIKASSVAWQTGDADTPAGSEIFSAMTALTDSASNNLLVSLNQSMVMMATNQGDYFGLLGVAPNNPDEYLHFV